MSERRFNEAEVAAIFEQATQAQQPELRASSSSTEGMTLAQLQEIGRDVGIPAESIALAAHSIGRVQVATSRTVLGLPLGVARTVNLDRKLSDEEWERLVVDLRETFNARGTVRREGSLRQWTNGNLQALLEPTATGHRIRLRTIKGDALGMIVGGVGMLGATAVTLLAAAARGALGDRGVLMAMGFFSVMGVGMLASSAFRLPSWAKTRRQQMEEIAARLAASTAAPLSTGADPGTGQRSD
jgi:hypothetical protein